MTYYRTSFSFFESKIGDWPSETAVLENYWNQPLPKVIADIHCGAKKSARWCRMLGWENSKHVNSDVFDLTSVFFRHNKFCNIIAIIGISAINYCILQFSTICILHRFYCNYRYAIFYWSSLNLGPSLKPWGSRELSILAVIY